MKHLTLPGSKSITNRDLILASLCEGKTKLTGALMSDDTYHMMNALRDLGIDVENKGDELVVDGGRDEILSQELEIYLGQSGTSIRFLTGLASIMKEGRVTFVGDERLMERPLKPLLDGMKQLGVEIESRENGLPPVTVYGGEITANSIHMDGTVSSQFFTALLNIGGFIEGGLEIIVDGELVSKPYIDMTIGELSKFNVVVENNHYKSFKVLPKVKGLIQKERNIAIEGDASALSYIANFIVLHGGRLTIDNLGNLSKQGDYKYLEILKEHFGLDYSSGGKTTTLKAGGIDKISPSLRGRGLGGGTFDFEDMPDVSMSFMSLAIFLPGDTTITGLQTLNLKECLRIDCMRDELMKLGVSVSSTSDSITIGTFGDALGGKMEKSGLFNKRVKIETHDDHRVAMTFGVLASYMKKAHDEELDILDPECVNKTYPEFWEDIKFLEDVEDVHGIKNI